MIPFVVGVMVGQLLTVLLFYMGYNLNQLRRND
jgi:hypothetical protein